jgi:FixJ family two-component response regulator
MIETEADLAKLTARQREVLTAIVRQLSKEKATRFSQIAETTANIDAEALLQAVAVVREALSKLESSSVSSISPALATLAEEWRALTPSEKAKRKSTNHSG